MVLKVFEKVVQNYMDHLKEINQRRNIFEQNYMPPAEMNISWN